MVVRKILAGHRYLFLVRRLKPVCDAEGPRKKGMCGQEIFLNVNTHKLQQN
jgi:hypothetical protein